MDVDDSIAISAVLWSVPMELGSHLFSSRTQKLSPASARILHCGKVARCRIIQKPPERVVFGLYGLLHAQIEVYPWCVNLRWSLNYGCLIRLTVVDHQKQLRNRRLILVASYVKITSLTGVGSVIRLLLIFRNGIILVSVFKGVVWAYLENTKI